MSVAIKKSAALNKLNLTPMIDVVFQLLIFFLVAARFEEEESAMPLPLPQASEAMPRLAKPKEIFINVDQAGRIFLGGQVVTTAELLAQLMQAQANNPGRTPVVVRGDERCDLKHVVAVMNVCAKAGIRDCRIAAAPNGT